VRGEAGQSKLSVMSKFSNEKLGKLGRDIRTGAIGGGMKREQSGGKEKRRKKVRHEAIKS